MSLRGARRAPGSALPPFPEVEVGSGEAVSSLRGAGPGADKAKGGGPGADKAKGGANLKEAALEHEKAAQGKQPASAEKPKKPAPAKPVKEVAAASAAVAQPPVARSDDWVTSTMAMHHVKMARRAIILRDAILALGRSPPIFPVSRRQFPGFPRVCALPICTSAMWGLRPRH